MGRKDKYLAEVDRYVGSRIHNLRVMQGYSRQELARMINVSNQQLHKYEIGINRICIGRLIMVARALSEKIEYFYDGAGEKNNEKFTLAEQKKYRMSVEVSKNFMKIESSKQRKAISTLIKSLNLEE